MLLVAGVVCPGVVFCGVVLEVAWWWLVWCAVMLVWCGVPWCGAGGGWAQNEWQEVS